MAPVSAIGSFDMCFALVWDHFPTSDLNRPSGRVGLPQKSEPHLDRVSTGSGSDLVQPLESEIFRKYRMLIIEQVATASCTDPIRKSRRRMRKRSVARLVTR